MFRCIENADSIKHIPMILYHWRIHMNSVAGDPASKCMLMTQEKEQSKITLNV